MKMNIAIIDDVVTDCQLLLSFIERYCQENKIADNIDVFLSGDEFLNSYQKDKYNIIFLDVFVGDLNGIEIAEVIRKKDTNCKIIFASISNEFAVKSFRVRAFDYIVKPYSYEHIKMTMDLCVDEIKSVGRYIELKEGRAYIKVMLCDIIYVDYDNHYVRLHTDKRMIKTYSYFDDFAPKFEGQSNFLQCYRNCIINIDNIETIDKSDFILKDGERIPISHKKYVEVKQQFLDYVFEKNNRTK
ncbi:MAG: LytTR family DNA-binding domain-containing protein [Clostridia bacterium]